MDRRNNEWIDGIIDGWNNGWMGEIMYGWVK